MVRRFDLSSFDRIDFFANGAYVLHSDYQALAESHARLLESMVNARALFSYISTDEVQQLWLKQTNEAIAAAQQFTSDGG